MTDFFDVTDLGVDDQVAEILPYFLQLQSTPDEKVMDEIRKLADGGNMYACYVFGIFHIFGRIPRYYSFNKEYVAGEVRQKALVSIKERLGLSYLVKLLSLGGESVKEYQLEGIYDLHKIIEGTARLFRTNDISCRPTSLSDPLYQLFAKDQKITDLLGKLDHYEVYLDLGESALERFARNQSEDELWTAMDYFVRITGDDLFCRFDQYDLSRANYHLGMLHLYGNQYLLKDTEKGVNYLVAASCDEGYCELIKYYAQYGDKYQRSIRRCIGLIQDPAIKQQKCQECGLPPPEPIDLMGSVQRLLNVNPVERKPIDYAAIAAQAKGSVAAVSVSAPAAPAPVHVEITPQSQVEVVEMFELIDDDEVLDSAGSVSGLVDEPLLEGAEDFLLDDDDEFEIPE